MPTFFQNAILVQLDPPMVERGNLRVEDGLIDMIGPETQPTGVDEIVECHGAVLMPGLVNGHTHLYSALAPGMPPPPNTPRNFHEILRYVWWRRDRAHTYESVQASGTIGALSALHCGTTTLIDHHASPNCIDGSLNALERGIAGVGCRAVLCYEVADRNGPDESPSGVAENRRYIESCRQQKTTQFSGMVGAHASFTLSDNTLSAVVALAAC